MPHEDLRDVVELTRGKPITGRVANRFSPDELLVLQGGKRVRIERARVKTVRTIHDHLRELLDMHLAVPDRADRLWLLAEWAKSKQLDAMARVFAYKVLGADPAHAAAHELLGHRRKGEQWLWRRGDRYMTAAAFERYVADIGHPLELASEHWEVRTDAGVQRAADTLLDLERLYLFFMDRFGAKLDAYEVLRPVPVLAWKEEADFPGWTGLRIPYYHPPQQPEAIYTFFAGQAARAEALFRTGVEALLNRCVAVDAVYPSVEHRLVDWFEIGFGQWVESQLAGPPGRAVAQAPRMSQARVRQVLEERRYPLPLLLTRNVDDHYYDSITVYKGVDWAYAEAFVAFLMADSTPGGHADRLLRYAFLALRDKRGDGSSTFDKALGGRIETLEKPFQVWLQSQGQAAPGR
jgi:hypothetical protein